jgi:hypothetical protein
MCLAGCYTLEPARVTAFPVGAVIALDITDQGRAVLGGSIGPEVGQIEGRLVSMDTSEYVLQVTGIRFLRGGEQAWTGEVVHVRSEYVSARYERRFSTVRSVLLGAVAVGAIAAVAAEGLSGLGTGDVPGGKGDSSVTARRLPLPRKP